MSAVAIIGVDGAGKTTIGRMLEQSPHLCVKYLYMGRNPDASNVTLPFARLVESATLLARAAAARGQSRLVEPMRVAYRVAIEWHRQIVSWWYQLLGYVVVYDRHFPFDYPPAVPGRAEPLACRFHRWLLTHWYPRPDLVIHLDAPTEILLHRKRELPAEIVARKAAELRLTARRASRVVVVDAARPLAQVYGDVARLVESVLGGRARATGASGKPRVAYIMSRFPKLSETFVFNEILAVERCGVAVDIYPIRRDRTRVVHAEVEPLVARARFHPWLSTSIVRANVRFICRQPRRFVAMLREVLTGTWGSPAFFLGALAILPKSVWFASEMEASGVTHVHAHFATHPAVAALVVHRLTGIPFSFTGHGSDIHVDRRMLDRKVSAAAFAVAVSDFNRQVMMSACGPDSGSKIHVVHCGVDPDFFRARNRLGPRTQFTMVCIARLEEVKGHRYLVEACRLLQERGVNFTCHLVGDGPMRRDLERQVAEARLGRRVAFDGARPRVEVAQLLGDADVVVLASAPTRSGKREGIPVALMEAMAAGVPVVATAVGGVPELVRSGRTGLVVPPADAHALADALELVAHDPVFASRMARAGRELVLTEFNQQTSARTLAALFTGVAPEPEVGITDVAM
jgi:glycosyltransferase involved in cell wall biosynthesis